MVGVSYVFGSDLAFPDAFWGLTRPKGVVHSMSVDSVIESLLNGEEPSSNASLYSALEDIQPPQLCKLTLALLAANHKAIQGVKKDIGQLKSDVAKVGNAPATYFAKLGNYVLNGAVLAVVLAVLKHFGVI